jgi:fluoroacetyl-CoA thioesterase
MKDSLRPGVSRVKRIVIDRDRTIGFMGEEARVYATPRLVSDIEFTCRELILEHADAGEDSVGMEIALKHLAPSLPGMTVEITVRVAEVDRRKITFAVTAKDELDEISAGTHTRFVVDVAKTIERLKAKAARRANPGGMRRRAFVIPTPLMRDSCSVTLRCERSEPRRVTARGRSTAGAWTERDARHPSRAASRPPQDDGTAAHATFTQSIEHFQIPQVSTLFPSKHC